jgi:hypothetical protein
MKSRAWRVCRWFLLTALCCCILVPSIGAQDKKPAQMSPEEAKMMELMMKYSTPGPQHQKLAKSAGTWKTSATSYMNPAAPETNEGENVCKAILGGRFFTEDYKGSWGGMPFEGHGISGYDNYKKEYFNIWMDNMGTAAMLSTGNFDAAGKVLTMTADHDDYMTGKKSKIRMVTTFVDDNKHVFEMFAMEEGKEKKWMEITYTRK